MQEITTEVLQIAYTGPATANGRMPMEALVIGLRGQALLIQRVAQLLYRDSMRVEVEVDAEFEAGSLVIPVHILYDTYRTAQSVLTSDPVVALATLAGLLSFFGIDGRSLYALFKRLKGRKIEKAEDIPRNSKIDIPTEALIAIYNDPEVQAQLRKVLEPLHRDGIKEFQTRRSGAVIERISQSDLRAADEAEIEDLTQNEEITLGIEKAAWRRDLAWHFNNGEISFDAKITHDNFWKAVERGEAFAVGDRLKVHLQTTARRSRNVKLKVQRQIPEVLAVEHFRGRQRPLFGDENLVQ
jgi:hypothetical protein